MSFCLFGLAKISQAAGVLRVSPTNPRYFTDDSGKAIYLTGSHTWDNLQDWGAPTPNFDYNGYLDLLSANNHNFIRLWGAWVGGAGETSGSITLSNPYPWARTGPGTANDGGLKYNLSQLNQAYFDRIRARVIEAQSRNIYVDIMLFLPARYSQWAFSPYNPANNVNGVNGDPNGDVVPIEAETLQNGALLGFQEAYVKKVIDTVNDLDNVLYEIINEAKVDSVSWQYQMINLIKNYEAGKPKKHPVGMTSDGGNTPDDTSYLLNSPADWVSFGLGSALSGTTPLPATGAKISILDSDHTHGGPAEAQWFWKSFLRGHNPINMEATQNGIPAHIPSGASWNDPENPLIPPAQRAMGYIRAYVDKMNLAAMLPSNNSSDCSTMFCLRDPGREYLVYQPSSGGFTVNLLVGSYQYEWFNPATGAVASTGTTTQNISGNKSFTPPFSGDAVVYLKNVNDTTPPAAPSGVTVQ